MFSISLLNVEVGLDGNVVDTFELIGKVRYWLKLALNPLSRRDAEIIG